MALARYHAAWDQASDSQLEADVELSDKYAARDSEALSALRSAIQEATTAHQMLLHKSIVHTAVPRLSRKERLAAKRAGELSSLAEAARSPAPSLEAKQIDACLERMSKMQEMMSKIEAKDHAFVGPAQLGSTAIAVSSQYDELLRLAPAAAQASVQQQVQKETQETAIKSHDHSHAENACSACDGSSNSGSSSHLTKCLEHTCASECSIAPKQELSPSSLELLKRCTLAARYIHSLALFRVASRQLQAGQADACMATCRRLLFQHPTFTRAWILRGKAFACVASLLLAQLHFDRALQLDGLKPGSIDVCTPHLEDSNFAVSSFDLQSVQSNDTRDDLAGSTVATASPLGKTEPATAAGPKPGSLARIEPGEYRQFVGHLLNKCFTSMACKRWVAAALDGTCHWDRGSLVRYFALPFTPCKGGVAPHSTSLTGTPAPLLPAFMCPPLLLHALPEDTAARPDVWAHLLFTRRVGRVLFREAFYYSAAAAFEAVAAGAAGLVGTIPSSRRAAQVLLAASLLNFAACLMKRRVQLASAVQACDAALQQLADLSAQDSHAPPPAAAGEVDGGTPAPQVAAQFTSPRGEDIVTATAHRFDLQEHEHDAIKDAPDSLFRLKMKCLFRKGQCLIDLGQYAAGMSTLSATQGELQDAIMTATQQDSSHLRSLMRPVQKALLRGKYIAQHSKRMVIR